MKEIQIPLQTLRQGDAAEAEAVNLRAYGKDSVAAVGNPLPIAALPGGDRLVGYDRRQGRTYYFSERDGALILLGYAADGTFTATGETIATLGSPVTAFASTGDFVVISTTDGLSYLHYSDGTYSFLGGAPQFPVMAFGTAEKVELSAEIAERRLSGTYSGWSGSLQSADLAAMEKQAVKAMENLQLQARQGFMLTSPAAIRTALRLWDGTMIWSPDATVVGTVSHPETVADVTMENSGEFRVERTVMRQNAWKLSLTLLSPGIGAWRNLVKAVEIYAAVWQDDTAGQATFRCEQSQQGEPQYFLRISTAGQNQEAACRQLAETSGFRLIATISGIEELIGGTVAAQGVTPASDGSGGDMSADTYAIDFNPGKQEAAYTPTMPPFSAKVTATVADRCFAGQISVKPPEPPRYQAMLSPGSIVKSPASVTVAVRIATQSGIRTISRTTLSDVWSLRLNGLVTYPDSRAVQASMAIVAGGKKYSVTVPMQRNAGGDMAYAVCPEGLELQPSTGESGYPGEQFEDYRPCDLLAAAPGNPLVWERCEKAGNRGIVALAPSLGLGSSWQLGRHSLCLFAAEGIYLLSFDTKGKCTGANLLSRRSALRQEAVVPIADGIAFADSTGEICRLRTTKVKPTGIFCAGGDCTLGYSCRYDEIWAECGGEIITVESGGTFYRRNPGNGKLVRLQDTALLAGSSFRSLENESGDNIAVVLRTRAIETGGGRRLGGVLWNVVGDNMEISLSAYSENGRSCCGSLISTLKAAGTVGAPLVHRVIAPYSRTIRLEIKGTVKPGTIFGKSACLTLTRGANRTP